MSSRIVIIQVQMPISYFLLIMTLIYVRPTIDMLIQLAKSISTDGVAAVESPIINFACSNSSVMESAGTVELVVLREGNMTKTASVK